MSQAYLNLESYAFNPWAVPPGVVACIMVSVALRALSRPGRFDARTRGAVWGLCSALWLGSASVAFCATNAAVADVWARVGMIGSLFLAPTALDFTFAFLGRRPKSALPQTATWIVAVLFAAAAALTDWVVSGVTLFYWGFYPKLGVLGPAFILYMLSILIGITAQHAFPRPRFRASGADRSRRRALLLGVLVANLVGVDMLAASGLPIYPFGWVGVLAVMIGAEYAQRRHGLWAVEQALQASQILDTINEGVLVVEEDFEVYFASRAAKEIFECGEISAPFSLTEATNGVLTESIHRQLLKGQSIPLLEVVRGKASRGQRTFAVSGSAARDPDGRAVGAIYVFRETTAYSKAQETLQAMRADVVEVHRIAREEAEKRLKDVQEKLVHAAKIDALGQMAGGVAHDFNNLLTAIIGNCDLAQLRRGPEHLEQKQFAQIREAAEQGAKITRQLLAYSRKQPLRPEVLDVNQVVTGATKLLGSLIPKNIAIHFSPDAANSHAMAEAGQLTQVLLNLAINARDAMPDGGRLTVRTYNATKHASGASTEALHGPGRFVVVSVSDTGCGMDGQTRRCMFDPFFTTKPAGKGTGLGLSTAYGAINQIGGDILVESELGRGSTFDVWLPVVDAPSATEARRPLAGQSCTDRTAKILVVEDDIAVRDILADVLVSSGHQVNVASDGVEAVRILDADSERVALVLTDLVMPSMGGNELAAHIAAHHPEIKVIVMSGHLGKRDMTDLHGLVSDILVKPFGRDELLSTVRSVLGRAPSRAAGATIAVHL